MVNRMMFAIPFQGLIAPKCVGVIYGSLPGFGLDVPHEFLGTHRLDDFGVDAGFPLQETKNDPFPGRGSAPFPLAFPSKVGLVQLDLALQFAVFQLGQMVQGFSHSLIDAGDHFDIHSQILAQPIGGLQLIESLQNSNLATQARQALVLSTERALHIPPTGVENLEGTTENTLAPAQKVGRTTKNRVSSRNHALFLTHIGYETP